MRLLRTFPVLVVLLVILGIIGLCAAEQSVKLLLVSLTLAALSWYVTEGPRGRILPRWVANLLVLAAALSVVIDLTLPPNDVAGVLGRFSIWITIIKLYQRRTARDHAHLMALSLLLMIVACLGTQELLFGVVLVLYATLGLYVLLLYQIYAAHEEYIVAHRASTAGQVAPAASPSIGRRAGTHFRLLAAAIGVTGLLMSVMLFLIFPRSMGRGMTRSFLTSGAARAGYADEVDLDAGSRISDSRRVVFDLRLEERDGASLQSPEPLRLRGAVLDRYRDGQWSTTRQTQLRVATRAGVPFRLGPEAPEASPRVTQRFRFRRGTHRIFSVYAPITVRTESAQQLRYLPAAQTLEAVDARLLYGYTVEALTAPTEAEAKALRHDETRDRASSPFVDGSGPAAARVGELARGVLAQAGVPLRRPDRDPARAAWDVRAAGALTRFLQGSGFEYTVDVSDVVRREPDPIVNFLFASRRGHCEFFASALAALCHTLGIDARVVTGYVATEYDEGADRYIVRDAHAHAWTEVRVSPMRFETFDPTPPGELLPTLADDLALSDRFEWFYQRLEGTWTSRVIQFDDRAQTQLLDALDIGWSRRVAASVEALRLWLRRVNAAFNVGPAGYIWLGIVALAVVIAAVAFVRLIRRYRLLHRALGLRHVRGRASRRLIRQAGFYPDMLHALHRAGHPKPAWQPPLAFARALGRSAPDSAALVGKITRLYYRSRYAGRRLAPDEVAQARSFIGELEQTLARDGRGAP